ncbi:MAG: hypothetical protein K2G95_05355, partial [Muribaculaceae bacterium]|nr:hypothetical protein [Muribaculaceae bacterium]
MDQLDHDMRQATSEAQACADTEITETISVATGQETLTTDTDKAHPSAPTKEEIITILNNLAEGDGSAISR